MSLSSLFNAPGFEPRTNSFKKFSHTKLARQTPYYNIMVPTPLGCYCCVGKILTRFSDVLIVLLQAASFISRTLLERCIPSGLYQECSFPNRIGYDTSFT